MSRSVWPCGVLCIRICAGARCKCPGKLFRVFKKQLLFLLQATFHVSV